jgi:hypothetical protein
VKLLEIFDVDKEYLNSKANFLSDLAQAMRKIKDFTNVDIYSGHVTFDYQGHPGWVTFHQSGDHRPDIGPKHALFGTIDVLQDHFLYGLHSDPSTLAGHESKEKIPADSNFKSFQFKDIESLEALEKKLKELIS